MWKGGTVLFDCPGIEGVLHAASGDASDTGGYQTEWDYEISHDRDNHIYATDTHCRMVWYEFCPYAGAFIAVWICGYLRHLSADCVDWDMVL